MAKIFVSDIRENQEVTGAFVVAEKQLRIARNGTPFLTLKLVDKTGEIAGRVWERADKIAEAVAAKGVVSLRGRCERFRDELQIQVNEIHPLPAAEIDPSDFLPVCPLSIESLYEKYKKITATVKRRPLHALLRQLSADRELMEKFKLAPAAKSMHHAYLGGLLEHTVSVATLVLHISRHYPELDRDLLVAGAIFHDIGKVDEFVYDLCIDYSHSGRLLGHMVLGLQILEDKIRLLKGFPEEDMLLLKHLILSHHGEAQLGAVKLPMTREAFALHLADDLDAKMNSLTRILSEKKDGDGPWTSFQPLFDRFFFRGLPPSQGEEQEALRDSDEKGVQLSFWHLGNKNTSD